MEERLARAGARLQRPDDDDDDDDSTQPTTTSLLLLPPSGPIVTVVLTTTSSSSWDDFFAHYFALQPGEWVDTQRLQAQAEAARQCDDSGLCPHVSPATLQRAAKEGTVQRIQKYNNHNHNSQDLLCLYYDESASFKQRPFNERATQYAREWAQDAVPEPVDDIYGDAFLVQRDGATT